MTAARGEEQEGEPSVRRVTESSRLVAIARAIGDWLRHSFLYRWLTKEPEPDVIVIDLRETYTVGPLITALDRVGARLAPWWRTSGCRRLCAATGAWLVARPIRALGLALLAVATVRLLVAVAGGTLATSTLAVSLGLFVVGALATQSRHSWQDIQATRGYQLVAAALEPPEPPEQQERATDESADAESEAEEPTDN